MAILDEVCTAPLCCGQTQLRAAPTITVARRARCKGHSLRDVNLLRNAAAA